MTHDCPLLAQVLSSQQSRTVQYVKELARSQFSRVEPENLPVVMSQTWPPRRWEGSFLSIFLQEEEEQFCKGKIQTIDIPFHCRRAHVKDII